VSGAGRSRVACPALRSPRHGAIDHGSARRGQLCGRGHGRGCAGGPGGIRAGTRPSGGDVPGRLHRADGGAAASGTGRVVDPDRVGALGLGRGSPAAYLGRLPGAFCGACVAGLVRPECGGGFPGGKRTALRRKRRAVRQGRGQDGGPARAGAFGQPGKHVQPRLGHDARGLDGAVPQDRLSGSGHPRDEDPILPVQNGQAIAAGIPGTQLEILRGVGHELPPGRLDWFAARIAGHVRAASS
jgi:hypothetical protein